MAKKSLPQFRVEMIESAVELSRPTRQHGRLSAKDAITAACRTHQQVSGNWGYWIRGLNKDVTQAITADEALHAKKVLERKSRQKSFSFA